MTGYAEKRIAPARMCEGELMQDAHPDDRRGARASHGDARPADRLRSRGTAATSAGCLLLLVRAGRALFAAVAGRPSRRPTTLQAMMFQLPELGLLSLAMAIPLISGGINLAIIATANQAGLLMAWILTALMPPDVGGPRSCALARRRARGRASSSASSSA